MAEVLSLPQLSEPTHALPLAALIGLLALVLSIIAFFRLRQRDPLTQLQKELQQAHTDTRTALHQLAKLPILNPEIKRQLDAWRFSRYPPETAEVIALITRLRRHESY